MIYICDIDSTIANGDHRLHHIQTEPKNWDAYHAACDLDTPIEAMCAVISCLLFGGHTVYFVTGRHEGIRDETSAWLRRAFMLPLSAGKVALFMRPEGDWRPDYEIKREWYESLTDEERADIAMVFEDRTQVVRMWRDLGLTVAQVADGDY